MSLEMLELLKELRQKVTIGFVGGSDLAKITEQLGVAGQQTFPSFGVAVPSNHIP